MHPPDRPIFYELDLSVSPPELTMLFVRRGRPVRSATMRLHGEFHGRDPNLVALQELEALTPDQIVRLAAASTPWAAPPPDPAAAAMIERLEREPRYAGPVFCPACCRRLGAGDSPAIGYLTRCPGCKREIAISQASGVLEIAVRHDPTDR